MSFGGFTLFNLSLFLGYWYSLGNEYDHSIKNLYVSSFHALMVTFFHLYRLFVWNNGLYLLVWQMNFSFVYSIIDTLFLVFCLLNNQKVRTGQKKYYLVMIVHHILLSINCFYFGTSPTIIKGNGLLDRLISHAFIAEASTPLLNQLRLSENNSITLKKITLAVFWLVRPINYIYVTYGAGQIFGWTNLLTDVWGLIPYTFVFFLFLNTLWAIALNRKLFPSAQRIEFLSTENKVMDE